MLSQLVSFSIRFRGVVIALALATVGWGLWVAAHAKLDVFPEFAPPLVVVQTEAPGLAPEEVEALVTRPIENALNGAGNLDSLRSQSIQGLSVVAAIFREGTDLFRARQLAAERLAEAAGKLPSGIGPPALAPLTSSTSMMLAVGLTSDERSPMELRTFADWTLEPRLLGVAGVAKVAVFGGEVRQLQIQLEPERLVALGLAIDEVLAAARRATGVRGAGFVETEAQRVPIRTHGQSLTPEALGRAVLAARDGAPVRLRDVARVAEGAEPKLGDASIQGEPGVILVVSSQYGANTREVTAAVEQALAELRPLLEAEHIILHEGLFRPANFIDAAIRNVTSSLALGGLLVAAVLMLFLYNLRTALISITAIPLSLLVAVLVLDSFGATLNTLTLGGLAMAIGEVVDDAIIDVENVFRRLRENEAAARPRPLFRVVLDASLEVRSAVVYATFIVALVFLPVMTMSGIQGRLFAPLGAAYVLAILASLAVALTVTPALSFALLTGGRAGRMADPPFARALRERYRELLEAVSRRPRRVVGAVAALCLGALATLPFFGGAFLPELREGHFIVHMSAVPGTSIRESLQIGRGVTQELLRNPHIRSVAQRVGRAEKSDDTWGTYYSELDVDLAELSGEEAELVQSEIRDALSRFPGVYFAIKPFLTERIEEVISGATAQVVVKLYGDDLDALDRSAREVARVLAGVEGAADVQVESPPGAPQMEVHLRPDRLQLLGFQPVQVLDAIQTAFQGTEVAQAFDGNRVYAVTAVLDPASRREPEQVGALLLRAPSGSPVPLREVADVELATGRTVVLHDGARRRQGVGCNVRGRDVSSFVAEAQQRVAEQVTLPPGVYAVFTGAAEAQARAEREILLYSLLAGAAIVALLAIAFGRLRHLLLVLANLPFAVVGGVLAVFLTGGWLSIGSLVGFVTLFGITTRNSIMMVSHFEHLVRVEGMPWSRETALRGAMERLVPISMTALVTALGLLPLALGSGEPGREIEGPMAIVILGGLASSTALNLFVMPTLAIRYARFHGPTEGR